MVREEGEEESYPEEVKAERGENLMLRRTLISGNKVTPEADWKRKSAAIQPPRSADIIAAVP